MRFKKKTMGATELMMEVLAQMAENGRRFDERQEWMAEQKRRQDERIATFLEFLVSAAGAGVAAAAVSPPTVFAGALPDFRLFDPVSELWTDYWSRFKTFLKAHLVSEEWQSQVFLKNQSKLVQKMLTNLSAQQKPPKENYQLSMEEIAEFMADQFSPQKTFAQVVEIAQRLEDAAAVGREIIFRNPKSAPVPQSAETANVVKVGRREPSPPTRRDVRCYHCQRKGHIAARCRSRQRGSPPPPQRINDVHHVHRLVRTVRKGEATRVDTVGRRQPSPPSSTRDVTCFNCQRKGHVASKCRARQGGSPPQQQPISDQHGVRVIRSARGTGEVPRGAFVHRTSHHTLRRRVGVAGRTNIFSTTAELGFGGASQERRPDGAVGDWEKDRQPQHSKKGAERRQPLNDDRPTKQTSTAETDNPVATKRRTLTPAAVQEEPSETSRVVSEPAASDERREFSEGESAVAFGSSTSVRERGSRRLEGKRRKKGRNRRRRRARRGEELSSLQKTTDRDFVGEGSSEEQKSIARRPPTTESADIGSRSVTRDDGVGAAVSSTLALEPAELRCQSPATMQERRQIGRGTDRDGSTKGKFAFSSIHCAVRQPSDGFSSVFAFRVARRDDDEQQPSDGVADEDPGRTMTCDESAPPQTEEVPSPSHVSPQGNDSVPTTAWAMVRAAEHRHHLDRRNWMWFDDDAILRGPARARRRRELESAEPPDISRAPSSPLGSPFQDGLESVDEENDDMPHVRIWDSISLNTQQTLGAGNFERAVSCVAFSKSDGGSLLAAVDDSYEHTLSIWDWQRKRKITETKSANEQVFACDFHPTERHLVVTCGKSHIHLWSFNGVTLEKKMGVFDDRTRPKYVLSFCFTDAGALLSGDSNGAISLWDTNTARVTKYVAKAHVGGVFSLCALKGGRVLTGGSSKDCTILEWTDELVTTGRVIKLSDSVGSIRAISPGKGGLVLIGTTHNSILQASLDLGGTFLVQGHCDELWGLGENPLQQQFVTCGYDKNIKLWDSISHRMIWIKEIADSAQCCCFHPNAAVLVVGTTVGRWLVLDALTREVVVGQKDGSDVISVVQFSPDGAMLAVGSHDGSLHIYQVSEQGRRYQKLGQCAVHSSGVMAVDWSLDGQYMRTNTVDHELIHWHTTSCKPVSPEAESDRGGVRDQNWATSRCPITFDSAGIHNQECYSGVTSVTACDVGHQTRMLVCALDDGMLRGFTYPSQKPMSLSRDYVGHSYRVTSVRYLINDTRVISVGAKDSAVFQWAVVNK